MVLTFCEAPKSAKICGTCGSQESFSLCFTYDCDRINNLKNEIGDKHQEPPVVGDGDHPEAAETLGNAYAPVKQGDPGVTVAELIEKLVQVRPMGLEHKFALEKSPHEGEERVPDIVKQEQGHDKQGGVGMVVKRGDDGQGGEYKT